MMESENQKDLLQQLNSLRAEKELLEKHVFVLNECLSVEELKTKISDLEKKKGMLVSLETTIGRLRAEIEPLKYLKSILKTKLGGENKIESYNIGSEFCIDLNPTASKFDKEFLNASVDVEAVQPVGFKNFASQSTQNIPSASAKTGLVSLPKSNDELFQTFQTPSKSNSASIVNDSSLDECMQLLDQYDVVTDQEILNFPTEENIFRKKIEDTQDNITTVTSTKFDAELINEQLNSSIKRSTDFSLNSLANLYSETYENDNSTLHKASTSQPSLSKESSCSDSNVNIGDLLLRIPQLLLQQGTDTVTHENGSSKPHEASTSQSNLNKESSCSDSNVNIGDLLQKIPQLLSQQGIDSVTRENGRNKPHEASTSQSHLNKESSYSDSTANFGDLLLKLPQLLLQQGIDNIKVEKNSNETLKNVNVSTNIASEEHTKQNKVSHKEDELGIIFKREVNKFLKGYNNLRQNSSQTTENNHVSSEQTESSQHTEIPPYGSHCKSSINSFNDMSLKVDILRGIYSLGFINPTDLQKRIIVHCVNGRDVIVFAGPGNGRTMMFTIPLLQRIKINLNECQVLVLVPTRDLAVHIQKTIMSVGDFMGVNVCIGGDNVPRKLSVVPHVVVGTPAGVSNMIACKSLRTGSIQTVVINNAEKMLTTNYTKLIEEIMSKLTKTKQVTLLTSDKLDHVLDIYMESLRDPLVIIDDKVKEGDLPKNLPKQFYMSIQEQWKINVLCEIIETLKVQRSIIFCNTLERAQTLCESLKCLEYAVSVFNLEMNAHERMQKLTMFSTNNLKVLITTDPIKGSQFQQAAWIINYDLPINPICYLDRVAKCPENIKVINLINENDDGIKSAIETHNKSYMIQMPLNMIDLLEY